MIITCTNALHKNYALSVLPASKLHFKWTWKEENSHILQQLFTENIAHIIASRVKTNFLKTLQTTINLTFNFIF